MDAIRDVVLPALTALNLKFTPSGGKWMAQCPGHEDHKPSLSLEAGREHPVVFRCQAGCNQDQVLDALGLTWADLCAPREDKPSRGDWTPFGEAVAVYDYRDEQGELLFQVCRTADKQFPLRVPDVTKKSGYRWKLENTRRVLYRLPKVLEAVDQCREIYLVEGEKDVHTLERQGLVATCNPGGANSWRPEYNEPLRGAVVIIWADNDKAGRAHARTVRDALTGIADTISIVESAAGKDATDHFTAGKTLDDLLTTSSDHSDEKPSLAVDLWQFLDATDPPYDWAIPGLLERGDRLILTGFEGLGKSMLVRQLAVAAAAGLDPFNTGYANRYRPQAVLFIDCENSETQSRRKLRAIAMVTKYLDAAVPTGNLRLIHRPEGIDLTTAEDAAWLVERVTAHKPDILVVGPFYRLHAGNMNDEQIARRTVSVLDAARAVNNCAVITEAHAGHGEAGKGRSVRPTGSSLLLRWPEFGYGIKGGDLAVPDDHGTFRHVDVLPWRGPRDEREWPQHLQYGPANEFPWQIWHPPRGDRK